MSRSFSAYVVVRDRSVVGDPTPPFAVWMIPLPGRAGCRPSRVAGGMYRAQADDLARAINGDEFHDYRDRVTEILLGWEQT